MSIEDCGLYDPGQGCPLHGELCAPEFGPAAGRIAREAAGPAIWECGRAHSWTDPCDECSRLARERREAAAAEEAAARERGAKYAVRVAGNGYLAEELRRRLSKAPRDGDAYILGVDGIKQVRSYGCCDRGRATASDGTWVEVATEEIEPPPAIAG